TRACPLSSRDRSTTRRARMDSPGGKKDVLTQNVLRVAGIDLGTNTLLLLVADVVRDGTISTIYQAVEMPRLGKEVDKSGKISGTVFPVMSSIVAGYRQKAAEFGATLIVACGTSALRDASNGPDLTAYVSGKTGVDIRIISGDEEGLLTYRGAVSGLNK